MKTLRLSIGGKIERSGNNQQGTDHKDSQQNRPGTDKEKNTGRRARAALIMEFDIGIVHYRRSPDCYLVNSPDHLCHIYLRLGRAGKHSL